MLTISLLVDNYVLNEDYAQGEPGLSMHLRLDGGESLLFDFGMTGLFMRNARRMGVDLGGLSWAVLSPWHLDHTWGLGPFMKSLDRVSGGGLGGGAGGGQGAGPGPGGGPASAKPILVCHPKALEAKKYGRFSIGIKARREELEAHFRVEPSAVPRRIAERLVFLGEIERTNEFEGKEPLGRGAEDGRFVDDYMPDDTALAYESDGGLVIVAGCSHSGICNIVDYARKVTGVERVRAVVGGLHLDASRPELVARTCERLGRQGVESLYACHCTDMKARIALARTCAVEEAGVGSVLEFA